MRWRGLRVFLRVSRNNDSVTHNVLVFPLKGVDQSEGWEEEK